MSKLKEAIQTLALDLAVSSVLRSPVKNFPRLVNWFEKFDKQGDYAHIIRGVRPIASDPDNNWNQYVINLCNDIDHKELKAIVHNFAVNASFKGKNRQEACKNKFGCRIPWAILMDPTSACNLHCIGCWAAEYGNKLNMTYEELDSIIKQGTALGTFFYIYSGGEPLMRKKDIIRLCEAHPDCQFLAFTNGTLIDEAFVEDMKRVKNFAPTISVEGFEKETDARRGKGTYAKVERAMALLKKNKQFFGVSCCYTSQNVDAIGSEKYFDQMLDWGAKYCWFFTYIPVGKDAVPELMVSAEQRKFMLDQVRAFRKTKPIFTLDFWNDGEFSHGCIAGGTSYLHINANGDYEPCAFIHYSNCNIRHNTLIEALQSPLFKAYQIGHPWNENLLRPCPLLDNPHKLAEIVDAAEAHSTDFQCPEDVHVLTQKCVHAAECWAPIADAIWAQNPKSEKYKATHKADA
ncbi:MAG TPA: radical SAM protein [Candidatus Limiplasma sp.]|nr:radical SAM protein [Candidatus Limiplasma sp.]